MRTYEIEDEGDYLEVHLINGAEKVAGALVDVEPLGVDWALMFARTIGECFKHSGGMGAQRPI